MPSSCRCFSALRASARILAILADPVLLGLTFGLIAVASLGKFAGAFVGAEIGGLTGREALALGFAMNARGSTEVIVASIGLSMGALTQNLFTMIVAMAVATTMAMPPLLRWGLSRVPMSKSERERLESEALAERGFLPNVERMLLAVDDSPNGRFASRLAGLIAARGVPITVLPVGDDTQEKPSDEPRRTRSPGDGRGAKEAVSAGAEQSKQTRPEQSRPVDVTVRRPDVSDSNAVADEARKGYDLLFIGLARTRHRSGRFHQNIERIASGFDGPLAIVEAKGNHKAQPERTDLNVLVPINGTEMARRGAEVAIAIARVGRSPLRTIYVSETAGKEGSSRGRGQRSSWHEQAVLKDIVELADRQDQSIRTTATAFMRAAEDAIIVEAGRNDGTLIVMGAARPAGEPLFFGEIAAALFDKAPASILLVSS